MKPSTDEIPDQYYAVTSRLAAQGHQRTTMQWSPQPSLGSPGRPGLNKSGVQHLGPRTVRSSA